MKRNFIRLISVFSALVLIITAFSSCGKDSTKYALEYKDASGKTTAGISQSFLSFVIATLNYQHGADSITDKSVWDMKVEENADTTVRDILRAEAVSYAKMLLQAEYLHDLVYAIGLDEQREDAVSKAVDALVSAYGSQDNLKSFLSTYGAGIDDLRRYLELSVKQSTLEEFLYSSDTGSAITDEKVKAFFAENYNIADYVFISLTGGTKDDGSTIPLTNEEIAEKKALADGVYNMLLGGGLEFDEAMESYSEADYSSVYPDGYFIPNSGTAQGLNNEITEAVREMQVGEIRRVETATAIYIVTKRPMNAELYKTKEGFGENLRSALESDDFIKQLATADGVVINEGVVSELDPAAIPSLDMASLAG